MRHSLRDLGDRLDHVYAAAIEMFDIDAWELRHRYIEVMLGDLTIEELAHELAPRLLTVREIRKVELLLRAQRMRQFMLTSCGWFFDGLGLEARNNLLYARKAVELTTSATGLQIIAKRQLEPHTYLTAEAA